MYFKDNPVVSLENATFSQHNALYFNLVFSSRSVREDVLHSQNACVSIQNTAYKI